MVSFRKGFTDLIGKLSNWQKNAAIIISVIISMQFFIPYIDFGYKFVINSYKAQREYENIETRLTHLEEYVEVVNGVIDGIGNTKYHNGVRFLITKGKPILDEYGHNIYDSQGDIVKEYSWYYLVIDEDGIEKWIKANYDPEHDYYTYVDHSGEWHIIKPHELNAEDLN